MTNQQVQYSSGWLQGLPTTPAVFGSPTAGTSMMGYEFIYMPNLDDALQFPGAPNQGAWTRMSALFQTFAFFRVKRMTVVFERVGRPAVRVQDVGTAATAVTNNARSTGAEAYFMCSRYGNYITSMQGTTNDNTWDANDLQTCPAFEQMRNLYPRYRKCMVHVNDMSRARRVKFSFRPTTMRPRWQTAFIQSDIGNTTQAAIPHYNPAAAGGEYQPQVYRPHQWQPVEWRTSAVVPPVPILATGVQLHGLCGAIRHGSWFPGDWCPWQMKCSLQFEFKRRNPPASQIPFLRQPMLGVNPNIGTMSINLTQNV